MFFQALFSQTLIFALRGTFKYYNLTTIRPISVKFGQMLENFIINTKVSENSE